MTDRCTVPPPGWTCSRTPGHDGPCAASPAALRPSSAEAMRSAAAALEALIGFAENQTCAHETTHRGGTIWTICDDCGQKWADDRGGFQPYVEPSVIGRGRAALAAIRDLPLANNAQDDYAARYAERCGDVLKLRAEIGELREDAERWRAFISSDRFYVMGWAGFTNDPVNPEVEPNHNPNHGLHFTLNVWDKHPDGQDRQGAHGRNLLMAYVDYLRAALTPSAGREQGEG